MNPVARLANAILSSLVRNRHHLPRPVNRLIDDVAKNPDGVFSRVASFLLGGSSRSQAPTPSSVPDTPIRVFIGPTNYAGQGYLWARALEVDADLGARNMAVELPGGFNFDADTSVPVSVYNHSTRWQKAELAAVCRFSHVLIEAERPLFGSLFARNLSREIDELQRRGISCAFLCHGTDVRSPSAHAASNRWSPFHELSLQNQILQADSDANLALLKARGLPVFISTPDLLTDVPWGIWCPVVVDADRWAAAGRELYSRSVPVVTHIPSMGSIKGTQLIEPLLREFHRSGLIEYRSITGVSSSLMPSLIGDSDIVLDQFRLGAYGVAAVEAMASGRIVVGHVLPETRKRVRDLVGVELPIVEADPESLREVLFGLIADPAQGLESAAAGGVFSRRVHSGKMSVAALRAHWIDVLGGHS